MSRPTDPIADRGAAETAAYAAYDATMEKARKERNTITLAANQAYEKVWHEAADTLMARLGAIWADNPLAADRAAAAGQFYGSDADPGAPQYGDSDGQAADNDSDS